MTTTNYNNIAVFHISWGCRSVPLQACAAHAADISGETPWKPGQQE